MRKKPLFDCQHNSFSFDQIFLKLADKADMDGLSDELRKLASSIYLPVLSRSILIIISGDQDVLRCSDYYPLAQQSGERI